MRVSEKNDDNNNFDGALTSRVSTEVKKGDQYWVFLRTSTVNMIPRYASHSVFF